MQIKTTMRYYYISVRMAKIKISDHTSVNKNFEKRDSHSAVGHIKWCSHSLAISSKVKHALFHQVYLVTWQLQDKQKHVIQRLSPTLEIKQMFINR